MSRASFTIIAGVLSAGCIDSNPIVTGHRAATDAGIDAAAPASEIVPASDGPDSDAADCRHCAETLNPDTARGTLCRKNASPSSASLLNDVVDCMCFGQCIQACAGDCAGAKQTAACASCTQSQCAPPLDACKADQ